MKKIFLIFLLFILSFGNIKAQWVVVSDTSMKWAAQYFSDNGTNLYAAIQGIGVYKTSNYGNNWTLTGNGLSNRILTGISAKDSMIFLATDTGLYKSTNCGTNWILLDIGVNCLYASTVIIANNYLYIGTYFGIKRSSDWGNSWELINNEINWLHQVVRNFAFSNNILYTGIDSTYHIGIYKSTNYGDNWTLINQEIPNHNLPYYLFANEDLLLCGTENGVYKSTNAGNNWSLITNVPIGIFGFSSIGMKDIFISVFNFGVYVSSDYGQNFTLKNEGLLSLRCTALYKFGNYLFLGTNPVTLPCKVYRRPLNEVIGIKNISTEIPSEYKLYQNYPNPFNPTTNIRYSVKRETSNVKLVIFDLLGKEVATLVNEKQSPGTYEATFDARLHGQGSNLSSGIYFYTLSADGIKIETKKMILMK